jgi:hypothetical protein
VAAPDAVGVAAATRFASPRKMPVDAAAGVLETAAKKFVARANMDGGWSEDDVICASAGATNGGLGGVDVSFWLLTGGLHFLSLLPERCPVPGMVLIAAPAVTLY